MKTLFIYNPLSGHMQIKSKLWDIINELSAAYDLSVHATTCQKDAYNYVLEKGRHFDKIICSGGDGTLSEVVNGLMSIEEDKRPLLGFIPSGSTNDYAVSHHIPKNMIQAAKNIIMEDAVSVDVGLFNSLYFNYVAAFGIFTEVTYTTPQQSKNILGHLAYILGGIKSLASIKKYKISFQIGEEEIEGKFILGMISNSTSIGGIRNIKANEVDLNDGILELFLIKAPKNALELTSIINYLTGIEKNSPLIIYRKITQLKGTSKERVPWTRDGEFGGDHMNFEISVAAQAIKLTK